MSAPTNEAGVVRQIARAVTAKYPDVFMWKVHGGPMQAVGMPDLCLCVKGLYVGIEVKFQRPGESRQHTLGRVTEPQKARIRQIIAAGGMAGVALNADEALEIIERGLSKHRQQMLAEGDGER